MRGAFRLAIALSLSFLAAAVPHAAHASCAPAPSLAARLAAAPVAFVGTVTDTSGSNRLATVHVEEIWKGSVPAAEVQMDGTVEGTGVVTSADRTYTAGRRYLFLPGTTTSPFRDIDCSGTVPYTPAVAALRPASALAPSTPRDEALGRYWILALVGTGVVALAAGLAYAITMRRRTADTGIAPG